jgi:hypothetical protein
MAGDQANVGSEGLGPVVLFRSCCQHHGSVVSMSPCTA